MSSENTEVIRHLADLCRRGEKIGQWQYSAFLTLAEQEDFEHSPEASRARYHFWGGREGAERRILAAGDPEEMGKPEYPLSAIRVRPVSEKFAEDLEHRDYLGALMNLGIERSLMGDLTIRGREAYFFCLDSIADYIASALDRVRRTTVQAEIIPPETDALQPEYREMRFTVASERLDAIVAGFAGISRSQAAPLFSSSKVMVNGRVETDKSARLKTGDILTVRGSGKALYIGMEYETRKGRLMVRLNRYI